ncbi:universal stress protein [Variovorax humicola]|jgi:nucleotide-binding universal stress UspA family protein|uniref:Universal stress protein n=1 Tax=Variovorax humicola TaxID=1769758 RepID=A0ABU8VZE6_9BURK
MMKILLPVDGSDVALAAVRHAIRLVDEGLKASFVVANVQTPANLYEMVSAPDIGVLEEVSTTAGTHLLASAEALLRHAGLAFESEVGRGDPGHTLVDMAEGFGCDMIIMQTSGAGDLRSALLGSVSHSVVHGAAIPVMLVKAVGD